jgi:molybdate transport system permease protein
VDWDPLYLSLRVALVATAAATVLGVLVAGFLAKTRFVGKEWVDALITAPMVLPPTVLGYYLLVAVGRRSAIGQAFESLTGSSIVFTKTGATIAAMVGAFPLIVKSSRAALESVDPTLVKAARTLGAGPLRAFVSVELPLAVRGIVAGMTLGFARALGDFGVTLMVAGDIPGETQTASLAIYDAIQAQRENEALGMIFVLTLLGVIPLYIVNKLTGARHVG